MLSVYTVEIARLWYGYGRDTVCSVLKIVLILIYSIVYSTRRVSTLPGTRDLRAAEKPQKLSNACAVRLRAAASALRLRPLRLSCLVTAGVHPRHETVLEEVGFPLCIALLPVGLLPKGVLVHPKELHEL